MNVTCPECRSVFRVDPAKVPATGVRARCSVCGGVIAIAGGTLPVSVTPSTASAAVPAFAGGVSRATPAPTSVPTPVAAAAVVPAVASTRPTPAANPVVPVRNTPVYAPPLRRVTPIANTAINPGNPGNRTPVASATVTPLSSVRQPTPRAVTPLSVRPVSATPAVGNSAGTPAGGKRPINPFLKADPAERSRRLARALVSDLVAYQPKKREEGLRDGTLRQLFREEIKKSYEEYVEQVGRDVAEQSPHFQDALNDILAGGRRLF
ncbi:MAG: zinc-ribbon domain-containing protein [Gemmatimonadaceae bacterium]|nr:zinc-ribbon domain-containing protein [Gemmatimonadaceae bacterium]